MLASPFSLRRRQSAVRMTLCSVDGALSPFPIAVRARSSAGAVGPDLLGSGLCLSTAPSPAPSPRPAPCRLSCYSSAARALRWCCLARRSSFGLFSLATAVLRPTSRPKRPFRLTDRRRSPRHRTRRRRARRRRPSHGGMVCRIRGSPRPWRCSSSNCRASSRCSTISATGCNPCVWAAIATWSPSCLRWFARRRPGGCWRPS